MAMENDILHTRTCSLCHNKLKLLDKHYLHMLSDGTLCQPCHMTILQLLCERRSWISEEEYMQVMEKHYSYKQHHSMPLEKAQALFALRDRVCDSFLKTVDWNDGNVFVAQSMFTMPKKPAIFILRAMKLKNKAVLQGFTLKGIVQKGDRLRLNVAGTVREFTALDVVPREGGPLDTSTFFSQLGANVHNHKIPEQGDGWIIIDTEENNIAPENTLAATHKIMKGEHPQKNGHAPDLLLNGMPQQNSARP